MVPEALRKIQEDFMRHGVSIIALAITASFAIGSMAVAQQGGSTQQVNSDPASNPDQELGKRFLIKPVSLKAW